MKLFAERGVADVTVRQIAAAAGVSPSLVIHHYRSKEGLKQAADERATALVRAFIKQLTDPASHDATSLTELFADGLDQEPDLPAYLRRLLVDGGPTAEALFRTMFDATVTGMAALTAAGLARPTADERLRAAFLLANDLALVMLRDQLQTVLGIDPLSRPGITRWAGQVLDVYSAGVYQSSSSEHQ